MKNSHGGDALLTLSRLFSLLRPGIGGVAASPWKVCRGVFSETAAPRWCQHVSTGVFLGDITNYRSTPPFGGRAGEGRACDLLIQANAASSSHLNVFLSWSLWRIRCSELESLISQRSVWNYSGGMSEKNNNKQTGGRPSSRPRVQVH